MNTTQIADRARTLLAEGHTRATAAMVIERETGHKLRHILRIVREL